jgi:mannose-6-phosphate isomerase
LLASGPDLPAGFAVAVVLSGAGRLAASDSEPVDIERGQTLVVPAAAGDWHVDGDVRLLVCRAGTTWPPNIKEGNG